MKKITAVFCVLFLSVLGVYPIAVTNYVHWTITGYTGGGVNYPYLAKFDPSPSTVATYSGYPGVASGVTEIYASTTWTYALYLQAGGAYSAASTVGISPNPVNGGDLNITLNITGGLNQAGTPPATTNWYERQCIKNDSSYPMSFDFTSGAGGGTIFSSLTVPAHSTACAVVGPFTSKTPFYMQQTDGPPLVDGETQFTIPDTNDDFTEWQGTTDGNAPPSWTGANPNVGGNPSTVPTGATNNIGFSGDTGAAKDSTLREGFSALREGLINGFNLNQAKLNEVKAVDTTIASGVDGVNTKLTSANSTLSNIKTDTGGIKSDTASIVGSTATSATKLGSIDTSLSDIRTVNGTIKTSVDSVKTAVDANTTATTGLGTGIASIASAVTSQGTTLTDINTGTGVAVSKLTDIAAYTLASKVANEGAASALSGNLPDMKTHLSYIRTAVEGTQTGIAGNGTKLDGINTRLDTANGHLLSVAANTLASSVALTAIGTELDSQGTSLDGIRADGFGAANQLTNVNTKLQTQIDDFRSFTNMLGHGESDANALETQRAAGESAGANGFAALGSAVTAPDALTGSGSPSIFVMDIPHFGSMNLDPLSYGPVGTVASALRSFTLWSMTILFFFACMRTVDQYVTASSAAQQTRAPSIDILGNSVGTLLGLPIATIITAALGAVPAFAVAYLSSHFGGGFFGTNPFSGFAAMEGVYYIVSAVIPVDALLADLVAFVVFRLSVPGVYWTATSIVRFMVG